jgi:hypothetical protein
MTTCRRQLELIDLATLFCLLVAAMTGPVAQPPRWRICLGFLLAAMLLVAAGLAACLVEENRGGGAGDGGS